MLASDPPQVATGGGLASRSQESEQELLQTAAPREEVHASVHGRTRSHCWKRAESQDVQHHSQHAAAELHIRCRSCRKPRSRMTCSNEHAEVWQQAVPSALEVAEEEQEGRKEAKRRESLELSRVES